MKILHVIPYFNPQRGGDVNVCYHITKHLVKLGHDVTIFTTDFEFDEKFARTLNGVRVVPIHCYINMQLFLYAPLMKKKLKKEINNFDIIHVHDFRTYQNIVIHRYAKKFGIPYILQAHGDIPILSEKQTLKKLYDIVWGKRILNDASKIIALTSIESKQYIAMNADGKKIEIVPNGIDLNEYNNLPKKGEFRKIYSIRKDEKIILFLGRLHQIKGINLLVDAYSELIKELFNVRLVIVGPDEGSLSTLKRQITSLNISDKVLFTGPLYEIDKLRAYVDADVYVLPSIYETFPNTVLEAWTCGTPVIVTKGCSISDIVENAGCVVNYNKYELKNAIIKVLRNDEEIKMLKENGKRLITQTFNIDSCINKIVELYRQFISGE